MTKTLAAWGPAVLWMGLLFFFSSLSHVPGESLFPFSDKVAHFGMFAVLGAALARASGGQRRPLPILVGALFAASDEWHQAFVPGRDPSYFDLMADLAGLTVGYSLVSALLRRSPERAPSR